LDVSSALVKGGKASANAIFPATAETKVRAQQFICSRFSHQWWCLLLVLCKAFLFNWIYGSV